MAIFSPRQPRIKYDEIPTGVIVASSGSAVRQNRRNIRLIIGREYKARVQKRSFVIGTLVLSALVVIASFAPVIFEKLSSGSQSTLAVVNRAGPVAGQDLAGYLNDRLNTSFDNNGNIKPPDPHKKPEFTIQTGLPGEVAALRRRVLDDKLTGLLVIDRLPGGELSLDYFTAGGLNTAEVTKIRTAASDLSFADKLSRLGIPSAQAASLFEQPRLKTSSAVDARIGRSPSEAAAAYLLATLGVVLIFTFIIQYGSTVATGAVEEKSNRVMEIIVNAATPFQLMIGKIIGIGLAGVTQVGAMVACGLAANLALGPVRQAVLNNNIGSSAPFDITGTSVTTILLILLYFVLGFLLYGTLYAALGSLISRLEEVQSALAPLTFIFMAAYFVSIFALQMIDSAWVIALSFVPFFTPTLMIARAALTSLQWWEVPVSVGIMLVTIVVFTWLAGRVYRAGVLMYGQKPSIGRLLKLAFGRTG